jgi:hypothetical protein
MAVSIEPFPKTETQAAELRMFGSCRHRRSGPIFLDAEVLCRTRASVSVPVIVKGKQVTQLVITWGRMLLLYQIWC